MHADEFCKNSGRPIDEHQGNKKCLCASKITSKSFKTGNGKNINTYCFEI